MPHHVAERPGDELDRARTTCRSPRRDRGAAHLVGILEDDLADIDRGDAVDHRLVGLAEQREAIALDALDQVDLPQRVAAIQRAAHDPRDEVVELLERAGSRKRRAPDVERHVEALVIHPDRGGDPTGHLAQALAIARDIGDAIADELDQALVVQDTGLLLEERQAADVHRRGRPLQVEE